MNLLSLLVLLVSCSNSIMASRAPEMSSKSPCGTAELRLSKVRSLQGVLTHIKKLTMSPDAKKLSGFHYYGQYKNPSIRKHNADTIIELAPELWIIIPAAYQQTTFHGGYVIFQGKNYGWKSFFPSSWNDQQLERAIPEMLQKAVCVEKSSDDLGNLYTYKAQEGQDYIKIVAHDIKGRFYIKTIYPMVQEVPIIDIQRIAEIQERQLAQAGYKSPKIQIDPINQAIEQEDVETILQLIENDSSPDLKKLLLQKSITYRKADLVDLMLALGAQITQQNVDLAFKASLHNAIDQEVVAALLVGSSVEPFINESIVKAAIKHPNKNVLQVLIKWLVGHEKEQLLARIPAAYKTDIEQYKKDLLAGKQEDIAKAQQTREDEKAKAIAKERKEIGKALIDWVTKKEVMPNSALMKKYFKDEQIVKFANKAITDSNDHVIKDLMSDDDFRLLLLQSNDLLQRALNRADSDALVNLFMDAYKKQFGIKFDGVIKEIIRTWVIKNEEPFTRAALRLIALYPEFASQWLRPNVQYFSDEQVLELLEKNPSLKDDDSIIQEVVRNKYQKSLAFARPAPIKEQECAAAPSAPMGESFDLKERTDKKLLELLAIIDKDDVLKRLYGRAQKYNKAAIDKALKYRATQKNSDEAIKVILMSELLKIVLKDKKYFEGFWSHDAFQIMINYENEDIIQVIMNNFKNNKKDLREIIERYFNEPSNIQTIITLRKINKATFDTIFAGIDDYQKLYGQAIQLLRDNQYDSSRAILEKLSKQDINPDIKNKSVIQLAAKKIMSEAIELYYKNDKKSYQAAYEKFTQVEEMSQVDPTLLASAKRYLGEILYAGRSRVGKKPKAASEKFKEVEDIAQNNPKDVNSIDLAFVKSYLGQMLYHGEGVVENNEASYKKFQQSEELFQSNSATLNHSELASVKRYLGEMLWKGYGVVRNYAAAYKKLKEAELIPQANKDKIIIKSYLAQLLYSGRGVTEDKKTAYEIFERIETIAQSHPTDVDILDLATAKRYLGEMLYQGCGVDQNIDEAYKKFRQVDDIAQNNPEDVDPFDLVIVKRYLGEMLYHGQGGAEKNPKAACEMFRYILEMAQNNPEYVCFVDLEIAKKYIQYYCQGNEAAVDSDGAAAASAPSSKANMKGFGTQLAVKILSDAIELYNNGDEQSNQAAYEKFTQVEKIPQVDISTRSAAKRFLGAMLFEGLGVQKNVDEAYKKLKEVEDLAQENPLFVHPIDLAVVNKYLGQMLYLGRGVEKNPKAAYKKFKELENFPLANISTQALAKRYLGQMLYEGIDGVEKDPKAACEKFREVIELAHQNLPRRVLPGDLVLPEDLEIAEKYIRDYCQENEEAVGSGGAAAAPAPSSKTNVKESGQ
ncbi:MAG: hypothetical protein P4L31_08680 [Candidatus Babeliales bacterium]|nr:hypothetical protein [Candidatus Babeliales bacterium]